MWTLKLEIKRMPMENPSSGLGWMCDEVYYFPNYYSRRSIEDLRGDFKAAVGDYGIFTVIQGSPVTTDGTVVKGIQAADKLRKDLIKYRKV